MISGPIEALLRDTPVFDGHNDLLWELRERCGYDFATLDVSRNLAETGLHTDLPRLRAGGVGAQFWSVYVPCELSGQSAVTATLEQIDALYRLVATYSSDLAIATSADEVEHARMTGRIACLIGVEGGHCIDSSLGTLRMMHRLGARYLTLTHALNTPWADSATDTPAVGGLNDVGRDVVRECVRLGMLVDLSHVAPATMHAALDATLDAGGAPAFFSHSNARALCDHPRNVPDDVLPRVRDSGGIVMATFVPWYLSDEYRQWHDAKSDEPAPPCGFADIAQHLEYLRDQVGIDHVGLGGDFDGVRPLPTGLSGVDGYRPLLGFLYGRGWAPADLAKLTWRNALRVLRESQPLGAGHP